MNAMWIALASFMRIEVIPQLDLKMYTFVLEFQGILEYAIPCIGDKWKTAGYESAGKRLRLSGNLVSQDRMIKTLYMYTLILTAGSMT